MSPQALTLPDPLDCRTCNICLGHCPTFKLKGSFDQSPTGRVRLISKVLEAGETLTAEETQQLNDCVECRACEKVCPSKMPYLRLLAKARAQMPAAGQAPATNPPALRALLLASRRQGRLRRIVAALRLYQRSGLRALFARFGLFKLAGTERLDRMLPPLEPYRPLQAHYPAKGKRRGAVALFTGCLGDAIHHRTQHAAVHVLTHLGYEVHIPRQQHCCGAMHAHNGDKAGADELAELNLNAFGPVVNEVDAILYTATGCASTLRHYRRRKVREAAKDAVAGFEGRLMDINAFIAEAEWPAELKLEALEQRLAVHEPCSQQHPHPSNDSPNAFLNRIPGLIVEPLAENNICCGAGGAYMLTNPEMSDGIRAGKLHHLAESGADILVTSNVGCALHLAAGARAEGLHVNVVHPVEVLARRIGD